MTWARSCAPWASDPPRRSWWTSCTRSTRTGEQRTNQSAESGHVTPSSSLVGQVRRDRVRGVLPAVRHLPGRGSRPRDHEEGAEGRLQVVFFNFYIIAIFKVFSKYLECLPLKYLVKNIFQNIFSNFLKKYFEKIFSIPKCYTILESWDQMPSHGFDKNLIWRIFFFNIQRGDPLDFQKRFLQCRGVIFQKKKFCVFGSLSNMSKNGLRMVVCLNFDITHLSPPSNIE